MEDRLLVFELFMGVGMIDVEEGTGIDYGR